MNSSIDGIPIEARATFHFACAKGRATCNMLCCTTVQLAVLQHCTPQELDVLSQIPHYVPISAHKEWNLDELLERMWEYANWAHPCHICTGLAPATSAPGLGRPCHLHRHWAHPLHICTRTGAHPVPHLHRDCPAPAICTRTRRCRRYLAMIRIYTKPKGQARAGRVPGACRAHDMLQHSTTCCNAVQRIRLSVQRNR